jgi:hypothetical protein
MRSAAPPYGADPGFRSPRSVATLLPTAHFHPLFVGPAFAAQTRIRAAKPLHTAGTFSGIFILLL